MNNLIVHKKGQLDGIDGRNKDNSRGNKFFTTKKNYREKTLQNGHELLLYINQMEIKSVGGINRKDTPFLKMFFHLTASTLIANPWKRVVGD